MCPPVQRSRHGAEEGRRRDRRQHSGQHGTSGQSPELPALPARSHLGRGLCTLSPCKLYILFSYLPFRVSVVIAHLEIEHCSSVPDLLHVRDHASLEKIHSDSRPPSGEDNQDLLTEKNDYSCIFPLLILNLVLPYVFSDLALV